MEQSIGEWREGDKDTKEIQEWKNAGEGTVLTQGKGGRKGQMMMGCKHNRDGNVMVNLFFIVLIAFIFPFVFLSAGKF